MNLDTFTAAYIECALWSSTADQELQAHENGGRSYSDLGYGVEKLAPQTLAAMIDDCKRFREVAGSLLDDWDDEQAGHDLWLTRNGHGAGFWDRGKDTGDALTALCGWRAADFREVGLYMGDDGLIYQSPG